MVYISEILINLQYFLRFSLYILWNPWNPYYLFWFPLLISAYKSGGAGFRREREGSLFGIYLFVWLETINYLFVTFIYIYIVHLIRNWNSVLRFVSLGWISDLNIYIINPQYICINPWISWIFWGFHPCILWNLRIC